MPTTTNFGWTTPADTDLVKDGAAAIRTLGNGIDTSLLDLKGGTTGQVLSKNSNTDLDYTWVTPNVGDITEVQAGTGISVASGTGPIPVVTNTVATTYDAKGDLVVGTGADTFAKLTVGTNGHTLVADSATSTGLKWAAPTTGAFTLVKRATFSNVANTGTTFDNVFTTTYVNYFCVINIYGSQEAEFRYQSRAGGSTLTSAYYGVSVGTTSGGSTEALTSDNIAHFTMCRHETGQKNNITFTINNVAIASVYPNLTGHYMGLRNVRGGYINALVGNGTVDGFILSASAGNIYGEAAIYGLATA